MSIRIGIGVDVFRGGDFTPITEYQAILDENIAIGGTNPSLSVQVAHNAAIVSAKANGAWAATDYFLAWQHDGSSSYSTINWKNPTGTKATMVNSPTVRSNIGIKGNGTNAYCLSEFIPSSGVNYTQSNCGIGVYCDDDFSNNGMLFGNADAADRQTYLANFGTTNDWNARISSTVLRDTNNIVKTANHYSLIFNGTNVIVSINDTNISFAQTSNQARSSTKLGILARNQNGNPDQFSLKTVSYFYAGNSNVATLWKSILATAFTAIRPAYSSYSLLSEVDINNTSNMWQDAAKTIAAVDGQPVRVIGGGALGDFVASADSDRAILTANGLNSRRTLLFDGTDDNYDFPNITNDLALIFVFKNTNVSTGSQIMRGSNYLTITGSGYSGNSSFGGEYTTLHPVNGSSSLGVKLKTQSNAFNAIAHLRDGTIYQNVNGFGITGRNTNASQLSLSNMGDPFSAGWQVKGELAYLLIYQGCPPDSVIEAKIFEMNTLFNI